MSIYISSRSSDTLTWERIHSYWEFGAAHSINYICVRVRSVTRATAHYMDVESSSWTTSIDMVQLANTLMTLYIAYNIIRYHYRSHTHTHAYTDQNPHTHNMTSHTHDWKSKEIMLYTHTFRGHTQVCHTTSKSQHLFGSNSTQIGDTICTLNGQIQNALAVTYYYNHTLYFQNLFRTRVSNII